MWRLGPWNIISIALLLLQNIFSFPIIYSSPQLYGNIMIVFIIAIIHSHLQAEVAQGLCIKG